MTSAEDIIKNIQEAAALIRKYDAAALRVMAAWESGDLAEAVRQLARVYRREA